MKKPTKAQMIHRAAKIYIQPANARAWLRIDKCELDSLKREVGWERIEVEADINNALRLTARVRVLPS